LTAAPKNEGCWQISLRKVSRKEVKARACASSAFDIGSTNMGNGERAGSGSRSDWPVKIGGGVGAVVAATIALLLHRDLGGFWPGLLAFVAVTVVGIVLGQLAGRLLSRRSSGSPPDDPPIT
jgi:hypothetical protein